MEGGQGDFGLFDWFLGWEPFAITHGLNPFYSSFGNWPIGVNLMANTGVTVLGFIMTPLTLLAGSVVTMTTLITLAFPLSAFGGYMFARRFVARRASAFICGVVYGYSPYMIGHGEGHMNLVFVMLPPLIFLEIHELFIRRQYKSRWRVGLILGLMVSAQALISTEVLLTTVIVGLIALVVLAIFNKHEIRGALCAAWPALMISIVASVILLAWPVYVMMWGPAHLTRSIGGFELYRGSFVSFFFPTNTMALWPNWATKIGMSWTHNTAENGVFLGIGLVAIIIAGLFLSFKTIRYFALLAVIMGVISLGGRLSTGIQQIDLRMPLIPLPGALLGVIPVINQAFPVRYSLYTGLAAGMVLALVVDRMIEWVRSRPRRKSILLFLPMLVVSTCLVPLTPHFPYPDQQEIQVPEFFTNPKMIDRVVPDGSVALVFPYPTASFYLPELWQAESRFRFRMPGGYFLVPGRTLYYTPNLTQEIFGEIASGKTVSQTPQLRRLLRQQLDGWNISVILVKSDRLSTHFFMWLTGKGPILAEGGMTVWKYS